MDSLFILEAPLLLRLKEQLAPLRPAVHVLAAADLAGVTEEKQMLPAVNLIYQGYRVLQNRADKRLARIEQTWLTVVAVSNARGLKVGTEARADAGTLGAAVLLALAGWQPPGAASPLELSNAPSARFSAGFQYLPQAFTVELVVGQARSPA